MRTRGVASLAHLVATRARAAGRPYVVALDGPSGAGKSTLAAALAERLDAAVVAGDDFFAGGVDLRRDSPAERARDCIDWRRQRPALEALRAGAPAAWRAFDWDAFDGRLAAVATTCAPRPIIVLEGVYSARPELADLVDLRVLVRVSEAVRLRRLVAREGAIGPWERQWHEAEAHYFTHVAPPEAFDVLLATRARPPRRGRG
ncbi:MAG: AAA family ATPase [Deltaproteobacteria bacterium]|nr:AAA family ATPase [Deltaproteobacteria bacterium]